MRPAWAMVHIMKRSIGHQVRVRPLTSAADSLRVVLLASALSMALIIHPLPVGAQSSGGHTGGSHSDSSHSGGGKKGGGHEEGNHEEGGASGHSGGRGKGGIENKIFRGGATGGRGGGESGGVEDRVFKGRGGGEGGSRPAWAGGGVPEDVELGRLNVARSPDHVLDRALAEAYATNLDKNADGVLDADAVPADVESPMQNLALFKEAVAGARKVSGTWTLQDAARFLGKAADKAIPITEDTVRAVGVILETPLDLAAFTYDRATAYPRDLAVVFKGAGYSGSGSAAFAQAADDARAVISYHHDNPE